MAGKFFALSQVFIGTVFTMEVVLSVDKYCWLRNVVAQCLIDSMSFSEFTNLIKEADIICSEVAMRL